ncbi:MAG: hypothetical protein SWO11_07085 [Thermodesulfobacteriota bacterium]|nr:hypothetical protein [Thermodesulfobacteriota bacterium]
MERRRTTINLLTVFLFSIILFASASMQKAYGKEEIIAKMTGFKGHLNIMRNEVAIPPVVNLHLLNNDRINVVEGTAEINFDDGSTVVLFTNTEIIIKQDLKKRDLTGVLKRSYTLRFIKIVSGRLWANVIPMEYIITEFETGAGTIQIKRGTVEIAIGFVTGTVSIGCPRGEATVRVLIAGITHEVDLTAGQLTTIIPGTPPTSPVSYTPGTIVPIDPETEKMMMKLLAQPTAIESPPETLEQEPPPTSASPSSL